jgi:hypothetical protein
MINVGRFIPFRENINYFLTLFGYLKRISYLCSPNLKVEFVYRIAGWSSW